jgi:hypothetical protein
MATANRDTFAVGTSAGGAQPVLEDRLTLARKLYKQAADSGHRLLAETWADRAREVEGEMAVIQNSMRRMARVAASSKRPAKSSVD